MQRHMQDWVYFLPDIAQVVNTTRPSVLPACTILYKVWFGCKPYWLIRNRPEISRNQIGADKDSEDKSFSETDIEEEEYTLTELEYIIYKNNTRVAAQMVKKDYGKARIFTKAGLLLWQFLPNYTYEQSQSGSSVVLISTEPVLLEQYKRAIIWKAVSASWAGRVRWSVSRRARRLSRPLASPQRRLGSKASAAASSVGLGATARNR